MTKRFKIGDHVTWNSEAGRVRGTIIAVHTRDFDYKGHTHHASEDDPQYEIKSDKTDRVKLPFFTIGHSNRSVEEMVEMLTEAEVGLVADIRKIPRSSANPQFNTDTLPGALAAFQISYEHVAALGGLRGKSQRVSPDVNGWWTNDSFHNYADYALSELFQAGITHLLDEGHRRRCAIMCSEAVWWRCHRRIIADYLIAAGETVLHIMGRGRLEPAHLTPGAVIQSAATIVYPAAHRPDP